MRGDSGHQARIALGPERLRVRAKQFASSNKDAQEAHEAIRPTDFSKSPDKVSRYLEDAAAKLYKLIWQRTLASQASSAEIERTTAEIGVTGNDGLAYGLRATGSVIRFDGFLTHVTSPWRWHAHLLALWEEGDPDRVHEVLRDAMRLDGSYPRLEAWIHRIDALPRA